MNFEQKLTSIIQLGELMASIGTENDKVKIVQNNIQEAFHQLTTEVQNASHHNGWFTKRSVTEAISNLGRVMARPDLLQWISPYTEQMNKVREPQLIGLVLAGNIPAVGFHDLLCVLMSGHKALVKLSSEDNRLIPAIIKLLISIEPQWEENINFADGPLKGMDAIIATGSNNSARYFEHYFGRYPHIIRKNRNGVAILTGNESDDQLKGLAKDILSYYGLGCRNVTHLYVPLNYDFTSLLSVLENETWVNDNSHYFHNYEYHKSIFLVNGTPHMDSGNLLLTESSSLPSAVSVLHYSLYSDSDLVKKLIRVQQEEIQCVVAAPGTLEEQINFGQTQEPALWDYADGIDTMEFLLNLGITS